MLRANGFWAMCRRLAIGLMVVGAVGQARTDQSARPNIVVILADDMGWSDVGCYGGEIRTPNIDRLAAEGLRFTRFFNSAKCEPTRASLMSGHYWQDVNLGIKVGPTMGEAMRAAGYATYAVGKWHLDGNPVERGFDHYFGHLSGGTDYFKGNNSFRLDDKPFKVPSTGFYTTDANAEYAMRFLDGWRNEAPGKPFFLYLAFNAPHTPLQAPPEDIKKYRGAFAQGWDALRAARCARQKEMGLIKPQWPLPERPRAIPAWDSLSEKDRDFEDLRMAAYAAMVDHMDGAIGRVLDKIQELGQRDNTLVMFLSDNGASPFDHVRRGEIGTAGSFWFTGLGWAWLSNAPFRHYKQNMFHGGACTPFIACWPAVIQEHGAITDQPGHIIDIMATALDLAGGEYSKTPGDKPQAPLPGRSLRPIFEGRTRDPNPPLFFQLFENRAVIAGDWKLVSDWGQPWSLFNLAEDGAETRDQAADLPEKAKELEDFWQSWWDAVPNKRFRSVGGEPEYLAPSSALRGGDEEEDESAGTGAPKPSGKNTTPARARKAK